MDKIRVQNVRSLKDTGDIELSPITLLVGENSSGKSTFLRLFPLIKQSISKRTDGPILWAGDVDDYVDFGSFKETVTNDDSDSMTFSFSYSINRENSIPTQRFLRSAPQFGRIFKSVQKNNICYSITISQNSKKREYISALKVRLNKTDFEFDLTGNEKILVDSKWFSTSSSAKKDGQYEYSNERRYSRIFEYSLPDISAIINGLLQRFERVTPKEEEGYGYTLFSYRNYATMLMQFIGQCLCLGIPEKRICSVLVNDDLEEPNYIRELHRKVANIFEGSEESSEILTAFKLLFFYDYFYNMEQYLDVYFHQVHYIAPLRATAERYYRLRNLAIDEVDYQGKNLAMFLSGLSDEKMKRFQAWTQEYFGFQVDVDPNGGHLSVKISLAGSDTSVNMSDTGFGYSQILPIIAQLWDLSTRPRQSARHNTVPLVVAIEQPELHLHPALQAKLARAFLATIHLAKNHGYQLQLLIETHSETIVNYFGLAIAKGELSSEEVAVILFDKDVQSKYTNVRRSAYDEKGFLKNWPTGFFAPKEW